MVEAACENKYNKLWVQSTYLNKKEDVTQVPAEGNNTNHETNAQSALASPSSTNSISQTEPGVNSEVKKEGADESVGAASGSNAVPGAVNAKQSDTPHPSATLTPSPQGEGLSQAEPVTLEWVQELNEQGKQANSDKQQTGKQALQTVIDDVLSGNAEQAVDTKMQGTNVESRRLTESDIDDYMSVGDRKHVRDTKQRIMDNGESPVLTKPEEIVNFIRNAFRRKIQKVIKGYGRVNNRLASAVKKATGGDVVIDDYYLELDADKIAHISDHVERDNDVRNIPLTEAQVEQLPSYIDTYDDLIDIIRRKDGSVRLLLGKKINGHSIIVETVSKGRKSLHPVTAYQIDSSDYMKYYKTRAIDRSSTSRPANTGTVDISRPTIAPASTTIASPQSDVNTNPVEGINISPNESVGAAPAGFDRNTHLQYQYGTLPEGEKAVRPDDLPVSTDGTNRVSQTAVTVKGAKVTSDEFSDLLTKDVTERNGMTYIPITNNATVQKAIEHITNEGWEAAEGYSGGCPRTFRQGG